MSVDLKNQTTDVEDANRAKTNLSRRGFLFSLTILGVGGTAAMTMRTKEANAATETDMASRAKAVTDNETLAEGKKAEFVQNVDPNDPLQHFAQPYYRHRRRVYRRTYRRARRRVYY
jgi:hypothetical protein